METKSNRFNLCDIYIILWCIYQLKGALYPIGIFNGLVHSISLIIGLFIGIKYIFQISKINPFLNIVTVLFLMFFTYWFFYSISDTQYVFYSGTKVNKTDYLLSSIDSMFPIFVFYSFAKSGLINDNKIKFYILPLFVVTIINYYYTYNEGMNNLTGNQTGVTMNAAYNFVSLFPLLFFVKKNWLRYVYAIVIVGFILFGVKRGAILIGSVSLLYFIYQDSIKNTKRNRIISMILGLVLIIGTWFYLQRMLLYNDYFNERLDFTIEGQSSGRDYIAERIWDNAMRKATFVQLFFGYGADSTVYFAGNFAHNDWLEILCNNGIVGCIIFIVFFIQMFLLTKPLKNREDKKYYHGMVLLFILSFMRTLFSMSIQNFHLAQCMLLGYLCYMSQVSKSNIIQSVKQ